MYDLSNEETRSPIISPWMATLVSVGVHGILGVVMPMIVSESEPQQTQTGVKILELTAAQQARLPSQSQTLPPLPLVPDELGSPSLNVPPSAAYYDPRSTSSLPSLNLPPLPPIPSYLDLSSLPGRTSSESILSRQAQNSGPPRQLPLPPEINSGPPRQLPLPPEINSDPPRQLPLPPDRQIDNYGKPVLETGGTVLGSDLQAYRPPAVNSPFSQLPQLEASAIDPQQLAEQPELPEFQGLSAASVRTHVGPLPAKIPQQAIDELRRLQALNRAKALEGTAAASIATGTTVELIPAQSEVERDPQGTASKPETTNNTAVPEKIPQRAIEELRRLQAQKREELASTDKRSPGATVAAAPSSTPTVESPGVAPTEPTVVAAVPEKIPQRAMEELRRLQAQKREELASLNPSDNEAATVAAAPSTTPTVESPAVAPTEPTVVAAVPEKIPQRAMEELRRLQAQKREELASLKPSDNQAGTSPTVPPRASATVEKSPETLAAKPYTSESEAKPTGEIPDRAIAQLRKLQQQLAYNPAGTTPAEALASLQAWLDASKKAASNPELLWEPKRITAEYPDAACRYGLDKNATDATVGVLVDPEGKISSQPETIESTGYALLNDIALEAASSYDFAASGEYKAYLLEIKFSHSDSCAATGVSGQ